MVDVTIGPAGAIQPAEVKDVELYHPKSWVTKYVFCFGGLEDSSCANRGIDHWNALALSDEARRP